MAAKKTTAKIEKRDGGYFFPEFDIHVIAKDEKAAHKLIKKYYGFDPDIEVNNLPKSQVSNKNNSNKSQPKVE